MDDDRRSLQCAVVREPAGGHRGPGRDASDHGAFLERRRAARIAVAPPGRRGVRGQYHAQCVRGQCRPVLHQSAQRPRSAAGRQPDAGHDRSRRLATCCRPTSFAPTTPVAAAVTQRVFLDELYRNYNGIQVEVRRRLADGLAWAVNYTGSVTKQYAAYDWYPDARGKRIPKHPQERRESWQPAAQL